MPTSVVVALAEILAPNATSRVPVSDNVPLEGYGGYEYEPESANGIEYEYVPLVVMLVSIVVVVEL